MEESTSLMNQRAVTRQTYADQVATSAGRTFSLNKKPRPFDGFIRVFLFTCAALSIFITLGFTVVLGTEAINFFATTEWLNINKSVTTAITAEDTRITLSSGGQRLVEGDLIRFGSTAGNEVAQITAVIDAETIEVVRGVQGTEAAAHSGNIALFKCA